MKVLMYVPYATFSPESGLMFLLANYIQSSGNEVAATLCDGVFRVCQRDSDARWQRGVHNCLFCVKEQRSLMEWAQIRPIALSQFVSASGFQTLERSLSKLGAAELLQWRSCGMEVGKLCGATLRERFGVENFDQPDAADHNTLRSVVASAALNIEACSAMLSAEHPQLVFIASGEDLLSAGVSELCRGRKIDAAIFRWDVTQRCIAVHRSATNSTFSSEFMVSDLSEIRPSVSTWSDHVIHMVEEILHFLEIPVQQTLLQAAP